MRKLATLAAIGVYLLAGAGTLNGGQPLTMQVSPAMAPAPAFISVRAHVEANDENRYLEIVAQSPDFYRSSRISLDGGRAPRLSVFQFPGLPEGLVRSQRNPGRHRRQARHGNAPRQGGLVAGFRTLIPTRRV